jgi:hypothetical protein
VRNESLSLEVTEFGFEIFKKAIAHINWSGIAIVSKNNIGRTEAEQINFTAHVIYSLITVFFLPPIQLQLPSARLMCSDKQE